MTEYIAIYDENLKPVLNKSVTAQSGEVFMFPVHPFNEEERENIPTDIIFSHIENLHLYMKNIINMPESSIVKIDETLGSEPWPVRNLGKFTSALEELSNWWNYAYYREEPTSEESTSEEPTSEEPVQEEPNA